MDCGWDLLGRRVLRLRVKYLHWGLLVRDERNGLDVLRLGRPVFFSPYHAYLGDHPSQPLMIYFFIFRLLVDEAGIAPPA